ncbi:MAG: phytanoyl-CoA dioxygenase family protein [Opitutaceae bacterium]|nr:phytanoyl-CoA dioxygenase family protein [Opitutaceae bacterium]
MPAALTAPPPYLPPAPKTAETAATLATLERDGFAVMKSIIPPNEVGAVRDSVAACVRQNSSLPPPQGYCTGFLRMNQSIAPYVTSPRLMAVIESLFGEFYRISHVTGTINAKGIKRANMHADWPYNQDAKARIQAPYPDVLMNMVTMWMLTDYTVENGGTIVIPGSHKRHEAPRKGTKLDPMATYPGEVQLQGKAGDVGLFDARTWHAIAPNISNEDRVGVIIRFTPWWLNLQPSRPGTRDRQQIVEANSGGDSKVEALPRSAYETLPESLKPLVFHLVDEAS